MTMIDKSLDFVPFFVIDKVRGRPRVVRSMFVGLLVRKEKRCMKYVMYGPGQG
jgi:hypothetical protein